MLQGNDNEDSAQLMCINAPLLSKYIVSFEYLVHNEYQMQKVLAWQVDYICMQGLTDVGT